MHYELYIDVLFLENFMMDSLLLFIVNTVAKSHVGYKRIFIAAAVGAILTCVLVCMPCPEWIQYGMLYIGVSSLMIMIGLRPYKRILFFKQFALLYAAAFFMGGIMQAFRPYIRTGSLFFMVAVISYYIVILIWKWISRWKDVQETSCSVELCRNEKHWKIQAIIDTGNTLLDPVSKKPVNIISQDLAESIYGEKMVQNILSGTCLEENEDAWITEQLHYIPYRTIHGSGVVPVLQVDKMKICSRDMWIEMPFVGIMKGNVSENEDYRMILNANILGGIKNGNRSNKTSAV